MSALSIEPKTAADTKVESYLKRFERRVEAAPPGQCPLTTVASLLETGANQTCGKCVPCRDVLPKLSELMRELADDGMTMIVVTHEMGFAKEVADEVWFMSDGYIQEKGNPKDFFNAPKTDRAKEFLAKIL